MTPMLAPAALFLGLFAPTPPPQPLDGPGGRSYAHERVIGTRLRSGAEGVYLFEPADPAATRAGGRVRPRDARARAGGERAVSLPRIGCSRA